MTVFIEGNKGLMAFRWKWLCYVYTGTFAFW